MKPTVFLFILLFVTSCSYFEKKKVNSEDLLQEELQTFDWNDVDFYPRFSSCDSIIDKVESKVCFQNVLLSHVNDYLKRQNIIVSQDINDTIRMKLVIENNGLLNIDSIIIKPETQFQIPEIDSLLRQGLNSIPKIEAATKRNQYVRTAFELPVIVKIN